MKMRAFTDWDGGQNKRLESWGRCERQWSSHSEAGAEKMKEEEREREKGKRKKKEDGMDEYYHDKQCLNKHEYICIWIWRNKWQLHKQMNPGLVGRVMSVGVK